jgi:hypothetical protein
VRRKYRPKGLNISQGQKTYFKFSCHLSIKTAIFRYIQRGGKHQYTRCHYSEERNFQKGIVIRIPRIFSPHTKPCRLLGSRCALKYSNLCFPVIIGGCPSKHSTAFENFDILPLKTLPPPGEPNGGVVCLRIVLSPEEASHIVSNS